ncbi:MAG TPA: HyaD/HybD family hydrogenase maturation endopeptidase [Sulfuriferula sp.]|nr:HyaD/HybD family hydrogenase maturation endopeptidase [Sulfuriferula sp.]
MTTLVLGIGNTLLCDEGVGVHAVRALAQDHPDLAGVEFMDGGTLSFSLAGDVEDATQLIVIDAAELDSAPGTVRAFVGEDMDRFLGVNRKRSVHEVGLLDLMAVAHLAGHLPQRRALIGIQPDIVDWGDAPTAAVAEAIPQACSLTLDLIAAWRA